MEKMRWAALLAGVLLASAMTFAVAEALPFEWTTLEDGMVEITKYTGTEAVVNVPGTVDGRSVASIGRFAFRDSGIVAVTLPDTVSRIDYSAFEGCKKLERVSLSERLSTIQDNAFYGDAALREIDFPETLEWIGEDAFNGCASLERLILPEGLSEMQERAFGGCEGLREVVIPGTLQYVPGVTFTGCPALEKVTLTEGVQYLGWACFADCTGLEEISLPASLAGVFENPFVGCTALTRVEIAEGNESVTLENGALVNHLVEQDFNDRDVRVNELACCLPALLGEEYTVAEDIDRIGYGAFMGCSGLKRVVLPAGLTEIGAYAFSECASLEEVRMPERLEELREGAFERCVSLRALDLTGYEYYIGDDVFYGCDRDLVLTVLPDSETEESAKWRGYAYRYPGDDETTRRGTLEEDYDESAD